MPGKADYSEQDYILHGSTTSLSATTVYIPVIWGGTLVKSAVSCGAAVTTADLTLTLAVLPAGVAANAVNVGGVLTVTNGTAAGSYTEQKHTTTRTCRQGDVLRFTPAAGTAAGVATYVVRIRR